MRTDRRQISKAPRFGVRLCLVATITATGLGVVLLTAASHPAAKISLAAGMSMGPDQCNLPQLAFCDTFQTKVGGGREGDLDPSKWSFTRLSENNNPSQGLIDNYAPSVAQFCKVTKTVQPDNDSFICGAEFNESNHWMESMDDNGFYALNSNRIRQPFDFANRTGNIVFDVDAKTEGPHSFWNEVWLTDQPVQGPHVDHPGTHNYPRNGVGLIFNADWCGARSTCSTTTSRRRTRSEVPASPPRRTWPTTSRSRSTSRTWTFGPRTWGVRTSVRSAPTMWRRCRSRGGTSASSTRSTTRPSSTRRTR
jgi:hypothetical protein